MVDFVEMRKRILEGEGEEPEISQPSALNRELSDNRTRAIGAAGIAVAMVALADRWKGIGLFRGKPDETTGDADMIPSLDGFGMGTATQALGQEHLRYGPPMGDFQSRTFGF